MYKTKKETPCLQYLSIPAQDTQKSRFHFPNFGTPEEPIPHRYSYDTIFLVRSGRGTVISQNNQTTQEGPCLIFFKKERSFAEFFDSNVPFEKYTIRTRSLSHPRIKELYQEINLTLTKSAIIVPLSNDRVGWFFEICDHLIKLLCEKRIPHTDERVLIPFCYLLEELLYTLKNRPQADEIYYSPHVKKTLIYINEHLSEKITLQQIADHLSIGKTKLCADFKKEVMMSVHQYLLNARLELAKQYLNKGHSISETAELSGFSDCAHFTRVFKKHFSVSPSKYQPNRVVDIKSEN